MISEPSKGPEGRRVNANTDSVPRSDNDCVTCPWMIRGLHFGRPELFCLCEAVRDAHADYFQLIGPRRMVRRCEAWPLCGGRFYVRAGDAP